jgi:hypothetical protein
MAERTKVSRPSTLRQSELEAFRTEEGIIVERSLIEDMTKDLTQPNVSFHRNIEAGLQMAQGFPHRRESPKGQSQAGSNMLPNIPDPDRHDVSGVGLP